MPTGQAFQQPEPSPKSLSLLYRRNKGSDKPTLSPKSHSYDEEERIKTKTHQPVGVFTTLEDIPAPLGPIAPTSHPEFQRRHPVLQLV